MNPKQFLQIGGAILVVLGVVGLLPVFTKANTPWFYLDTGENVAHIGLGLVAIAASFLLTDPAMQKRLVFRVWGPGVILGLYILGGPGQSAPSALRPAIPAQPAGYNQSLMRT